MAAFYADNDASSHLVPLLQGMGHDVVFPPNLGYTRATDDQQLLTAFQLGRVLLTCNRRDFLLLHRAWHRWPPAIGVAWPPHPGVLVLPQPRGLTVARVATEVDNLVRSGRPIADEFSLLTIAGRWQRER